MERDAVQLRGLVAPDGPDFSPKGRIVEAYKAQVLSNLLLDILTVLINIILEYML